MVERAIALEVKNLKTDFYTSGGIVRAVRDVSFHIPQGEILGIVGESGSGKTVIALSIMRLVPYPGRINGGEIIYKGEDLVKKSNSEMVKIRGAEIGMIFQDPMSCLNPVFNVGEQITSGIVAHRSISRDQAIGEAIQMLKLVNIPDPERRVYGYQHEFSGGMKQRVMIALALSNRPNVLIADNPTTALDSTIQIQFLNLILDLRKRFGMTIIYITHELGIVSKLCDRVVVLYAGEIIEIGSVRNVLRRPKHPYTQGLINSYPTLGMRHRRIEPIQGKPPDLICLPAGCKFSPRCPKCFKDCLAKEVDLIETGSDGDSHLVRCLM